MTQGRQVGDEGADAVVRAVRSRDANGTRQRLLQAARVRFARDGYAGTTVRDIASDAGVNVALIHRYFTSKEGLFEACLRRVVDELDGPEIDLDLLVETTVRQLLDVADEEHSLHLLLLLRSSGDERADAIRRSTLRVFAENIATAAGARPADGGDEALLLRGQVALASVLGILLLHTSIGLEPLSSATVEDLRSPVRDLLSALLPAHPASVPTA